MSTSVESKYGSYNQTLKNPIVREPKNQMDQDMFLKILVTQMQNQDPMAPTSDTEFIGQMAQFSSLEQMTKMSASMLATQAYSLVGKYVYAEYVPEGSYQPETVMGKVDTTFQQNGITYVTLHIPQFESDGKTPKVDPETGNQVIKVHYVPLTDVKEVIDPGIYDESNNINASIWQKLDDIFKLLSAQSGGTQNTGNLVGRYVYAEYQPEGSADPVKIAGKIDAVYKKDGVDYVTVSRPQLNSDGTLKLDEDGKAITQKLEIPASSIKETVEPGKYDDSTLGDIWRRLDEIFSLLNTANGG